MWGCAPVAAAIRRPRRLPWHGSYRAHEPRGSASLQGRVPGGAAPGTVGRLRRSAARRPCPGPRTSLWIPNPGSPSTIAGVGGLFGPRPRPLTMGVRERGRGPNRKRVGGGRKLQWVRGGGDGSEVVVRNHKRTGAVGRRWRDVV